MDWIMVLFRCLEMIFVVIWHQDKKCKSNALLEQLVLLSVSLGQRDGRGRVGLTVLLSLRAKWRQDVFNSHSIKIWVFHIMIWLDSHGSDSVLHYVHLCNLIAHDNRRFSDICTKRQLNTKVAQVVSSCRLVTAMTVAVHCGQSEVE